MKKAIDILFRLKQVKPLLTKITIAMGGRKNEISFKGQKIYVGIDVHLKSWSVTILSETSVLKKFSQHPSPQILYGFLMRSYPGAEYHSVYEAGFCGFWIHERLMALGIDNIVVNQR